jgi:hypothetical protein
MTDLPDNAYFPVSQSRPEWSAAMIKTHGPAGAWGRKAGPCRAPCRSEVARAHWSLPPRHPRRAAAWCRADEAVAAAYTAGRLAGGSDGTLVATAAVIILASPPPCEALPGPKSLGETVFDPRLRPAVPDGPADFCLRLFLCSPQHSSQLGTPTFFPHQSSRTPPLAIGQTPAPAGSVPRGFRFCKPKFKSK